MESVLIEKFLIGASPATIILLLNVWWCRQEKKDLLKTNTETLNRLAETVAGLSAAMNTLVKQGQRDG